MGVTRALVMGFSGIAALLCACSFLVPFTDYDRETAAGADADADAAAGGDAASCTETMSDPLNCGACGHDCRGTSCLAGLCQSQMILPAGRTVAEMTLDDTFIYVAYPETGELFRFEKDLSNIAGDRFATGLTEVQQLFVSGADIFWFRPTKTTPGARFEIGRSSKADGTAPERAAIGADLSILDADAARLYYRDEFGSFFGIDRSLKGSPIVITIGIFDAFPDGDRFYATAFPPGKSSLDSETDRVVRMDKNGANKVTLTAGQDSPTSLGGDESFLYWSNSAARSAIMRLPKDAGPDSAAEELYGTMETVYFVKVLGDFLYFVTLANQSAAGVSSGRVWRLARSGGKPLPLTEKISYTALAIDATHLYWASDGAIHRSAN